MVNKPNSGHIIAVVVCMGLVVSLWVGMRVWARLIRKMSPLLPEDILCYLALLSFYGLCANGILMVALGGAGLHITQLQPYQVEKFSQTVFAAQVLYALCLGFTKLSIARCLQRIFFTRTFCIAAYTVMACTIAWTLQTILVGVLICQPIELNWDPNARGTCGDQTIAFTSVAAVDIATDLMLMILPLKPLIALRIRTSHKIALCLIFGAGLITIVVTAIRLYFVYTLNFSDLSFSVVRNNYLNIIQPGIAVIVSCSPLLKPILDRVLALSPSAKHNGSSASSANTYNFMLQSVSRRIKGGNRLLLSSSHQAPTGFSQLSDSEQHLHVELGNRGRHEAQAMAEESPYPENGSSNPDAWPNDRILVTHQTVVQRDNS